LRARDLPTQQTEAAIGVAVLNRMLTAARPNSFRCKVRPAWHMGKGEIFIRDLKDYCRYLKNQVASKTSAALKEDYDWLQY